MPAPASPAAPPPEAPTLSLRRRVAYIAFAIIASLLLLEGVARVMEIWWPPLPVDHGLGFDPGSLLFVPGERDGERVTNPTKRKHFHTQRFSAAKAPGTLRVVALGGSSVYLLEEQLEALKDRLQPRLRGDLRTVEIINAGGHSYGSHRLVAILIELLEYEPDVVLLYSGHNEFEEVEQLQLANLKTLDLRRTLSHSALLRLIRDLAVGAMVEDLKTDHNRRLAQSAPDHARAWRYSFTEADVSERMAQFEQNLALMVRLSRSRDVPIIIGTVPSDHRKPYLPKAAWRRYQAAWAHFEAGRFDAGFALGRKILAETVGRHQSSDTENAIIRAVAKRHDVPLADVERAVIAAEPHGVPGETLFRDHCHLNEAGNALWRETYEPLVIDVLGLSP